MLAAQFELESGIADLRSGGDVGAALSAAQTQLGSLQALQQRMSGANTASLATMRAEISAATASAASLLQQVRASGATAQNQAPDLAALSANTRREVQSLYADLFEQHMFDGSLTFASNEEEQAYRRREAERRAYIEEQLAKQTPEGDLNAAGATTGQMLDAHAHGAGDNPEFLERWNRLVETTRKQREAMRAEGRSTEEFDRVQRESVCSYLKRAGLTDAEIEARLAVASDPLDAVKPYIDKNEDSRKVALAIERSAGSYASSIGSTSLQVVNMPADSASISIAQGASAPVTLDDVMAKLQSSGIVSASEAGDFSHGVTANAPSKTSPARS